jgi:hypothetical protein
MATATETKERIERMRAHCNSTYDVMMAFMGWDTVSPSQDYCGDFRSALIDLLERSDPDGWTEEQLCEWGLVRLPRDKDGEVIRIGDTVWDDNDNPYEWTVIGIGIGDVAPHFPIRCANKQFETGFKTEKITHRLPVTVESVLREFAGAISEILGGEDFRLADNDELYDEYAKRLRLAKEDE